MGSENGSCHEYRFEAVAGGSILFGARRPWVLDHMTSSIVSWLQSVLCGQLGAAYAVEGADTAWVSTDSRARGR